MDNEQTYKKAKDRILFVLRQADSEELPLRFPSTEYIRELVDDKTAQKIYEEIILEMEKVSGSKIKRF
jgi:hypothetical protein